MSTEVNGYDIRPDMGKLNATINHLKFCQEKLDKWVDKLEKDYKELEEKINAKHS